MLTARLRNPTLVADTPNTWSLGRFGSVINAYALVYTAYVGLFTLLPSTLPVAWENMNYAGPIFGLVVVLALALWVVWARKGWRGLNKEVIDAVVADADRRSRD